MSIRAEGQEIWTKDCGKYLYLTRAREGDENDEEDARFSLDEKSLLDDLSEP